MKTALFVVAQQNFRDEEFARPRDVLESHGVSVVTASIEPGVAIGKLGMSVVVDLSLAAAAKKRWDCVVFVGGAGAAVYFDDPVAHSLACDALAAGAVVSAICIAPSVLARAGLLRSVRATAFSSQRDDLIEHGALWDDGPVVVSGLIVTANGPDAAEEFGSRLAEILLADSG